MFAASRLVRPATQSFFKLRFSSTSTPTRPSKVPIIGAVIGACALTFQVTVLYPWHEELSEQFETLQSKIKERAPKENRITSNVPLEEIDTFYSLNHCAVPSDRPYIWTMTLQSLDGRMSFREPGRSRSGDLARVLQADPKDIDLALVLGASSDLDPAAAADWKLLNAGWAQADAVLGSGLELSAEPGMIWIPTDPELLTWRKRLGKSELPLQVIVSKSGDIPVEHAMFQRKELKNVIYTTKEGEKAIQQSLQEHKVRPAQLTIHSIKEDDLGSLLRYSVKHLRENYHVQHLDITAGSVVLGHLLDLGIVDEVRLGISGQLIGPLTTTGQPRPSLYNILSSRKEVEFRDARFFNRHLFLRGRVLHDIATGAIQAST